MLKVYFIEISDWRGKYTFLISQFNIMESKLRKAVCFAIHLTIWLSIIDVIENQAMIGGGSNRTGIDCRRRPKKDPITGVDVGYPGSTCLKDTDCCFGTCFTPLSICSGSRRQAVYEAERLGCGRGKDANGREIGGLKQTCKTYADCCFESCIEGLCTFAEGCGGSVMINGQVRGSFGTHCGFDGNCCSKNCVGEKCAQAKGCGKGKSEYTGQQFGSPGRDCKEGNECCSGFCTKKRCD